MRIALLTPILLLLIPAAGAHGCDLGEDNPCAIPLNTDPDEGMYFETPATVTYEVTQGDWLSFDVANWYDDAHILSLEGYGRTFEATPFLESTDASWGPIQFTTAGVFELRDDTSGDFAVLVVQERAAGTDSSDPAGEDSPGIGLIALIGVVSLAALRRR
jgi:MYXO-CTERM domain-containing protein